MPFDGVKLTQQTIDLMNARNLLVTKGWRRGAGDSWGSHCSVTAIMEAQGHIIPSGPIGRWMIVGVAWTSPRYRQIYNILINTVRENGRPTISIERWNDRQQSSAPVLELFDRAISNSLRVTE